LRVPEPTVIRRPETRGEIWGDPAMGEVTDAWYVSTDAVHMLVYAIAPGGWFGSTDEVRTIFDADQLYYVLEGTLALANPANGEVRLIEPGEAAYVGSGTWTHGFACGEGGVRVLELVSPGLESDAAVAYTRDQPPLGSATYVRGDLHGSWPMARHEAGRTIHHLCERDLLWRLDGPDHVLSGSWVATGRVRVEMVRLRPGQRTSLAATGGETCVYVLNGCLGVRLPESERPWLELDASDGLYLPAGTLHRFQTLHTIGTRVICLTAS
jgi:mannose-6-phosphate isomerase-like protein (cupin superfamily)